MPLKVNDIVCWEGWERAQIGIVTEIYKDYAQVLSDKNTKCYYKQRRLTKIGTMPKQKNSLREQLRAAKEQISAIEKLNKQLREELEKHSLCRKRTAQELERELDIFSKKYNEQKHILSAFVKLTDKMR